MARAVELEEPTWPQHREYPCDDQDVLGQLLIVVGACGLISKENGLTCTITFNSQAEVDKFIATQNEYARKPRRIDLD